MAQAKKNHEDTRGDGNATKTALAKVTVLNLNTRLCTSSPFPQALVSPTWPWHCQMMVLERLQKGLASSCVCFPWLWWLALGLSWAQGHRQPVAYVQMRRDASSSLQMLLWAKVFCRESRAQMRFQSPLTFWAQPWSTGSNLHRSVRNSPACFPTVSKFSHPSTGELQWTKV